MTTFYAGARGPTRVTVHDGHPENPGRPLEHHPVHSPDGFEWGYCGSGPADLADAILADVVGYPVVDPLTVQQFKRDVVACLDRASFVLSGDVVRAWLDEHGWPKRPCCVSCRGELVDGGGRKAQDPRQVMGALCGPCVARFDGPPRLLGEEALDLADSYTLGDVR